MSWPEITGYKEQKKHELVLSGPVIDERIQQLNGSLHPELFGLSSLNFLEVSSTSLAQLPANAFEGLGALIHLVLRDNKLNEVPVSIGSLKKLRFLDVSSNVLKSIPDEINQCQELQSLNVRGNALEVLPPLGQGQLTKLSVLDVSNNQLKDLPDDLTCLSLSGLSEIYAQNNQIASIPAGLKNLHVLKTVNLENNLLVQIPPELSLCVKLKDLNLKGNKLADKRLAKMVTSCKTSSVIEYLHKLMPKEEGKGKKASARKKAKARSASRGSRSRSQSPAAEKKHVINITAALKDGDGSERVVATDGVLTGVRPHILCCVVEDVDFNQTRNLFKRFISMQTKLHDTVANRRIAATIATHDNAKVNWPITYDARHQESLMILPLMRTTKETAESLKNRLVQEAEEARKKAKRDHFSGIHKYLDLVRHTDTFACMVTGDGATDEVISLPPITNSDVTKISPSTTSVLFEVTSATSLAAAKRVMDALVKETLLLGLTKGSYDNVIADDAVDGITASLRDMSIEGKSLQLRIRQVRVTEASTGNLRSVYPSNVDLDNVEGVQVVRD